MAAFNSNSILPSHQLFSSAANRRITYDSMLPRIKRLKLTLLPDKIISINDTKIEEFKFRVRYMGPCKIVLKANLSPKPSSTEEEDSCIYLRFNLEDHTQLKVCSREFIPKVNIDYSFDCPLTEKPFVRGFSIKRSQVHPLMLKAEYPVKREHLHYFETEINSFLWEILSMLPDDKHDIIMDVRAHIERAVWQDEAMELLKEIESEGRWNRSAAADVDDECEGSLECAVCLDDVRLKWFDGIRLPCNHVFHVNCISPWFQSKDTCPTCRRTLF